jgi:hypothetical protein
MKRDAGKSDRVTLRVPGLGPQAILKLKAHSDSLVRSISVNEKGLDGAAEVTFTIAPGADFFDYMTDQPSRLVLDFFPSAKADKKVGLNQEIKEQPEAGNTLPKSLPAKEKAPGATTEKSQDKRKPASDSDAELESEGVVVQINPLGLSAEQLAELPGSKKKSGVTKRKPASGDFVLTPGKGEHLPSKAEEISAKKEFSHGISSLHDEGLRSA